MALQSVIKEVRMAQESKIENRTRRCPSVPAKGALAIEADEIFGGDYPLRSGTFDRSEHSTAGFNPNTGAVSSAPSPRSKSHWHRGLFGITSSLLTTEHQLTIEEEML